MFAAVTAERATRGDHADRRRTPAHWPRAAVRASLDGCQKSKHAGPQTTGWPLDPFGFGEAWARALGIRESLSRDVTRAIRTAMA